MYLVPLTCVFIMYFIVLVSVFNILGLAVSAKELLLIVDRPRTYSAKVCGD